MRLPIKEMKKRFTDGLRWVCKAGIIASDCLENDGLWLWDWHWYFDCDWDWISGEWFPGWHLAFKVPNFFGEHGVSSGWRADLFAKPPARHLHLHRSSNTHFNSSCARARPICLEFFSPFCSSSRRSSFTWWHLLHSSDSSKYLQIYVDPGNWDGAAALATTVVEWHLMSGDWSSSYCHFHRCSAAWCGAVQCGAVWLCALLLQWPACRTKTREIGTDKVPGTIADQRTPDQRQSSWSYARWPCNWRGSSSSCSSSSSICYSKIYLSDAKPCGWYASFTLFCFVTFRFVACLCHIFYFCFLYSLLFSTAVIWLDLFKLTHGHRCWWWCWCKLHSLQFKLKLKFMGGHCTCAIIRLLGELFHGLSHYCIQLWAPLEATYHISIGSTYINSQLIASKETCL